MSARDFLKKYCQQKPLLLAVLVVLLSSCTQSGMTPHTGSIAPDPSILRVGVSPNAPPLVYYENGRLTGLEPEFARKLARYVGREVKFVTLDWKNQIPALLDNQIDIVMSGMSITDARQYQIAFSNPYLRSGQLLLVRLDEKPRFSTGIYSLMNSSHIVGTVKGTTGDFFITKNIHGVNMKHFKKPADAVKALINNKIDVFVYDAPMICHYAAVNENNKLVPILTLATEEYNAWGIRKEDTELLSQANAFLEDLKSQQELQRIIRSWIPFM